MRTRLIALSLLLATGIGGGAVAAVAAADSNDPKPFVPVSNEELKERGITEKSDPKEGPVLQYVQKTGTYPFPVGDGTYCYVSIVERHEAADPNGPIPCRSLDKQTIIGTVTPERGFVKSE